MDPTLEPLLRQRLEALDLRQRRRRLQSRRWQDGALRDEQGRALIDCSSNDYLGLSQHPLTRERAAQWASRHGAGAPASRLVTGTRDITTAVEEKLAAFKGCEAALVFPSGFQTNATVIPALAALGDTLIFSDSLNHASLVHGCRLAKATTHVFRHNDAEHLRELLEHTRAHTGRRLIVTETVFSMDGDRAPLRALRHLAEQYGATLYVDEAHATGALGPQGRGLAAEPDVQGGVDVVMGTLGKGVGAFGAYIAGSRALIDYLVNACAGIIYTTALPPAVLGAVDAALDLIPGMDAGRAQLAHYAERLRGALAQAGFDTLASTTQIIPAVIGTEADALAASRALLEHGVLAVAIRPPTVPKGSSRLRFSLHADMDEASLQRVLQAVSTLRRA